MTPRIGVFALLALTSCSFLGGPSPKESFYTLTAPESASSSPDASQISVFVGPVSVPQAVDRLPMVIRTGPNEVDIDEFNRWAEPLKAAIPRVIAELLMRELGTPKVMASRFGTGMAVDYRVAIEVQRFESSLDQGATIDALWTITPAKGSARTGRTTALEPAPSRDPRGIAAAHSRALARVARDIAAALREKP